jgi:O-antigen/teichoic acid export membrane protein
MLRSFIKDSAIYAIPQIFSKGINLILLPLYTRILSPNEYGSLDLLLIFAAIINVTIALEVSQGLSRFYITENDLKKKKQYASSALWFTFGVYLILSFLIFIFADNLSSIILGKNEMSSTLKIGGVYIFINGLYYLIQHQFRWQFQSKDFAIASFLMSFSTLFSTVIMTYCFSFGLNGVIAGLIIGNFVGAIFGLLKLSGTTFSFVFSKDLLIKMLKFSFPLVFASLAVWSSQYIDRIMINYFLGTDQLGIYSMGFRVASIIALTTIGIQSAITPLIYDNYQDEKSKESLAIIFRLYFIFAVFICMILFIFIDNLMNIFATGEFFSAKDVVFFLAPSILLSNIFLFFPGIAIVKKTYLILTINVIGALSNLILNLILIKKYGITGAAYATLISSAIAGSMYVLLSQYFYKVPHEWKKIIIISALFFVLIIINDQLKLNFDYKIIINSIILFLYLSLTILLGIIKKNEIEDLLGVIKLLKK